LIAGPTLAALAALAAGGCAQILGLDDTQRRDASGPGVCDQPIDCTGAGMRAICGQLVDAVTGQAFQRVGATGAACLPTDTDGPCGFAIAGADGADENELFSTIDTTTPATVVDDCGRFKIEALTGERLAVVATPVAPADGTYRKVIRGVLHNDLEPVITGVDVVVVRHSLVTDWETQSGQTIPEALLLLFRSGNTLIRDVVSKINTVQVPLPPAVPYALYFGGPNPFETVLDPVSGGLQARSGATGTGLVFPVDTNPFTLGGSQPGKNCLEISGVRRIVAALVWIDLTDC
jgi:hypothetical protein